MPQLKTPGVYTKETPTLAPSVAEVSTAVPVFIGYTEKGEQRDADGLPQAIRVSSMLEYRDIFGDAYYDPSYTVKIKGHEILDIEPPKARFLVSPSMEFYFKNGGSAAYVISLGDYQDTFDKAEFEKALAALEKTDVPTLICLTDAVNLHPDDYHDLVQQALLQCAGMDNRFCILDVLNKDENGTEMGIEEASAKFRESIGNNNLMYGAAYYPYVKTTLTHPYTTESVRILGYDDDIAEYITGANGVAFYYQGDDSTAAMVSVESGAETAITVNGKNLTITLAADQMSISATAIEKLWQTVATSARGDFNIVAQGRGDDMIEPFAQVPLTYHEGRYVQDANGLGVFYHGDAADMPKVEIIDGQTETMVELNGAMMSIKIAGASVSTAEVIGAWDALADKGQFSIKGMGDMSMAVSAVAQTALDFASSEVKLKDIKYDKGALYNDILAELKLKRMTLPPSAGIAGIYANMDNNIGVWQAPANVGIASVIEPTRVLNAKEQENFNVDVNAGKSINVIRNFTGKGNLVWGARTLAGNDNEWRYINVRRLFNMVKASLQKSTGFAVFQPNSPITWLKVRAMMESYLEDLWQAGGLVGETKDDAYFVRVGLGSTMNEQDILEGRMNIEVGLRAGRPAEFIVINFTHHVQES